LSRKSQARHPKRSKKKYFGIYTEIISALLKNDTLTESQIGDYCGYKEKGTDKFSNVDRQIKKLVSKWSYVEHVPESPSEYRIKRDLDLIRHIYDNEKFSAIRSDFSASTWLIQLIVKEHMEEFSGDEEFIEDLKKMVETSSSMFEFFLRGTSQAHISANLGLVLGPTLPVVKMPGINRILLKLFTGKCGVYDLFLTTMWLEHGSTLRGKVLSEKILNVYDEMKRKSIQHRLAAIDYVLSYVTMQKIALCIEVIQKNRGRVPPYLVDIVQQYNAIAQGMNPKKTDPDLLMAAARDMSELYKDILKLLEATPTFYKLSGLILPIGPVTGQVNQERS